MEHHAKRANMRSTPDRQQPHDWLDVGNAHGSQGVSADLRGPMPPTTRRYGVDEELPPHLEWRCTKCGKRSRTRSGRAADGSYRIVADWGWTHTCFLAAEIRKVRR